MKSNALKCGIEGVITHYQHLNLAIVTLFMKSSASNCKIEESLTTPALVGYLLSTLRPRLWLVDNNDILFMVSPTQSSISLNPIKQKVYFLHFTAHQLLLYETSKLNKTVFKTH